MDTSELRTEVQLEGVPLWQLIFFSILSLAGIIYSLVLFIFNATHVKNKVVKMTSPNINMVILGGVIVAYGCMTLAAIDTSLVDVTAMESLQKSIAFLLPICFSVVYGALFAKAWRVFLVFKNLNFNGKLTRDEHLLFGVLIMILLDVAILLPWILTDPIKCERRVISTKETADAIITYEIDECRSEMQELWVSLLYIYKFLLTLAGLYFTWQTRNVTLPSLRDTRATYVSVLQLVTCALIALPVLMVPDVGMRIRVAIGDIAIWATLSTTLSLLFLPKIFLARKSKKESENSSAFNFLFSESMRKTQDAIRKCSLCFCCPATEADQYGQEMLANEIDTLKRTIKQKDATIRELNDRLYIGTEKFHEYLASPLKQHRTTLQAMQMKHAALRMQQQTKGVAKRSLWSDSIQPSSTPQRAKELEVKELDDALADDEGIHSCDSYRPTSEEPSPSLREGEHNGINVESRVAVSTISTNTKSPPIKTVSSGHVGNSCMDSSTAHSYKESQRSSCGSLQSRQVSFTDKYNALPWRPPSPVEDIWQPAVTPQVQYDSYSLPRMQHQHQMYSHTENTMHINKPEKRLDRSRDYLYSQEQNTNSGQFDQSYKIARWSGQDSRRLSGRSLPDKHYYNTNPTFSHSENTLKPFAHIDLGAMEIDAISDGNIRSPTLPVFRQTLSFRSNVNNVQKPRQEYYVNNDINLTATQI